MQDAARCKREGPENTKRGILEEEPEPETRQKKRRTTRWQDSRENGEVGLTEQQPTKVPEIRVLPPSLGFASPFAAFSLVSRRVTRKRFLLF